jgi:hypothetical protein
MFETSNLPPAEGRGVAFGNYLSVICGNLCPNAAPLQDVEDTSQTSPKTRPYENGIFFFRNRLNPCKQLKRT